MEMDKGFFRSLVQMETPKTKIVNKYFMSLAHDQQKLTLSVLDSASATVTSTSGTPSCPSQEYNQKSSLIPHSSSVPKATLEKVSKLNRSLAKLENTVKYPVDYVTNPWTTYHGWSSLLGEMSSTTSPSPSLTSVSGEVSVYQFQKLVKYLDSIHEYTLPITPPNSTATLVPNDSLNGTGSK